MSGAYSGDKFGGAELSEDGFTDEAIDDKALDTLAVLHEVVAIVSAYFSHNAMPASDLPAFITSVYESVTRMSTSPMPVDEKAPDNPAVAIKRSVTKDFIVCLEDGKKFKSLRRHLSSFHNLTPDAYRTKWSLPIDYPMVAPSYSAVRSRLARDYGLGQMAKNEADEEGGSKAMPANRARGGDESIGTTAADRQADIVAATSALERKVGRGRPRKPA